MKHIIWTSNQSRSQKESAIKAFANSVSFVDINPSIRTHLGKVTMLDQNSALIEEIGTDWCTIGHLQNLTDEELNQVFTAVQAYASKLLTPDA